MPGVFGDGYCLITVDLDQDEDADLIGAGRGCNRITWWENDLYSFNFKGSLLSGHTPLPVQFSDLSTSTQPINAWKWDFDNDGMVDSQQKNTEWTYDQPGIYTVDLEVAGDSLSHSITYEDYISVFDGESALLFDGKNSYASCSAAPCLNLQDNLTIEAKINPTNWGEVPSIGFGRIVDKKNFSLYLIESSSAFNNHSVALQIKHDDGSTSISTSQENSITLDMWQHVAVTYNGNSSEVKIFINGIDQTLAQTKAPSGIIADNNNNDLIIGNTTSQTFTFDGIIDEIRMWNIVRTKKQIQENINLYLNGDETGLVGYWNMNEANGDTLTDNSNNNNNVTIVEANWIQGAPLNLPTAVKKNTNQIDLQNDFSLYQNYPNPFNSTTKIIFSLPYSANLRLNIFDINGRLVKSIINNKIWNSGNYTVQWDGTDDYRKNVSSGLYLCKLETNKFNKTIRLLLLK